MKTLVIIKKILPPPPPPPPIFYKSWLFIDSPLSLAPKKLKHAFCHKATGAFIGTSATAGLLQGRSLGVAVVGTAVGVPLVVIGAGAGLATYGGYKAFKSILKKYNNKENGGIMKPVILFTTFLIGFTVTPLGLALTGGSADPCRSLKEKIKQVRLVKQCWQVSEHLTTPSDNKKTMFDPVGRVYLKMGSQKPSCPGTPYTSKWQEKRTQKICLDHDKEKGCVRYETKNQVTDCSCQAVKTGVAKKGQAGSFYLKSLLKDTSTRCLSEGPYCGLWRTVGGSIGQAVTNPKQYKQSVKPGAPKPAPISAPRPTKGGSRAVQ